jgi:hypothetical protein
MTINTELIMNTMEWGSKWWGKSRKCLYNFLGMCGTPVEAGDRILMLCKLLK